MRKPLLLVALGIGLVASACDPASERADRDTTDHTPVDLGALELVALSTEDTCGDLLAWFKKEAAASVDAADARWWWGGWSSYPPGVVALAEGGSQAATADEAAAAPSSASASDAAGAPAAGVDYSATNVQEDGVDEPDVVKTDGERLVALAGGHLRVVDVSGDEPTLRSSVPMPDARSLLLVGDRVMAIGEAHRAMHLDAPPAVAREAAPAIAPTPFPAEPKTIVTIVDIGDPAAPEPGPRQELAGSFVSARLVDGVARVVLRSSPYGLMQKLAGPEEPIRDEADMKARVRAAIDSSVIEDWVPPYVPCEQVHHPRGFTGPEMVSVVSIDPEDPRPGNGAAVAGAGETVYASERRLYVTSHEWSTSGIAPSTEVHAFDITDPVTTTYTASGSVAGNLLNQFSLSEHEGVLRLATTTTDAATGQTESQVVTLNERDGALHQLGLLGGLGRTERIYAVRFLGDLGYVVTFRQTDPLYVVDLSDPAAPTLKGELKIPGYSAYLHPIGDGRLLGVGQDATEEGRRLGSQLSLFDVSDPASPKQLATHDLGAYGSSAEYDHHAFLWWARTGLVVVPVESGSVCTRFECASAEYRPGAVGVTVDGDRLVEKRRIEHPTRMPISRSIVIGDRLLTLSESGVLDSDLSTLESRGWIAF